MLPIEKAILTTLASGPRTVPQIWLAIGLTGLGESITTLELACAVRSLAGQGLLDVERGDWTDTVRLRP